MKLICNQSDLNAHLSLVSRAVPSRPSHPILANVLLTTNLQMQQVSLTAFDLSLGIQTSFSAQVEEEGTLTLPAKLLNDIVSRLPNGEIVLEVEQATSKQRKGGGDIDEAEDEELVETVQNPVDSSQSVLAILTSLSGQYQVRGLGASEFPELPKIAGGETTCLSVEALIQGLQGTLFASSTEETKQILTGIHLSLRKDGLEFAATDGHRLSVVETENVTPDHEEAVAELELEVTIPARTLRELERMLATRTKTESVAVHFDTGQVVFEWEEQQLTSRLVEGQYPNYRQLIPRQFARQVTIERKLLLGALERIAVLADQKNNVVKITLNDQDQLLALSVEAQDVGMGRETIPAQISGDSLDVAFNVKYLMDGLKALNTTEIQMQLNTATSPVILTPLGSLKMTYLVMPIQIRS